MSSIHAGKFEYDSPVALKRIKNNTSKNRIDFLINYDNSCNIKNGYLDRIHDLPIKDLNRLSIASKELLETGQNLTIGDLEIINQNIKLSNPCDRIAANDILPVSIHRHYDKITLVFNKHRRWKGNLYGSGDSKVVKKGLSYPDGLPVAVKIYETKDELLTSEAYQKAIKEKEILETLRGTNIEIHHWQSKKNANSTKIALHDPIVFKDDIEAIINQSRQGLHNPEVMLNQIINLMKITANDVANAHAFGIVNSDISASNITIDGHLFDWDLATTPYFPSTTPIRGNFLHQSPLYLKIGSLTNEREFNEIDEFLDGTEKKHLELEEAGARDIFALGVVFYELVFSQTFYNCDLEELTNVAITLYDDNVNKTDSFNINFESAFYYLSEDIKNIITGMLHPNPEFRLKAHQIVEKFDELINNL
ncbi:MAG: hypothetical protein JHC93_07155 [Parachlamydiales bacterium]|nr:hypothetical protein [Parachlamydiales bacterium]